MTDPVLIALIGGCVSITLSAISAGFSYANNRLGHKNADNIKTLEVNTNSMKDALVSLTDKEAFARGQKDEAGRNAAIVPMPGPAGPQGPIGETGPQGDRGEPGKSKLF